MRHIYNPVGEGLYLLDYIQLTGNKTLAANLLDIEQFKFDLIQCQL